MIRRAPRPGLTLLEVIVSVAIFATSATAIYYLSLLSDERALEIYDQTKASLLCQSKLAEVSAGVEAMNGGGGYAPFPSDDDYEWRMEAAQGDVPGLYDVQIWVRRERPGNRTVEVQLCQKVLDPARRGSTFDAAASSSSSSSSTPNSGSSSGSSPAPGSTTGGS